MEEIGSEEIGKLRNLRFRALITPDEGGPNHSIIGIEQYGSVHLPGEADGRDFVSARFRRMECALNRQSAGSPPIVRILLCPSHLRRREGNMLFGTAGQDSPMFVHNQRTGSAGADIDPEKSDISSPAARWRHARLAEVFDHLRRGALQPDCPLGARFRGLPL